jgi:hypothetical protein
MGFLEELMSDEQNLDQLDDLGENQVEQPKEAIEEAVDTPARKKAVKPTFFKGYDIRWLKNNPEHPDFNLVAEYEAKYGEI